MNDPYITQMMPLVRSWVEMPLDQAKASIKSHMEADGDFKQTDYELLNVSESAEEAIGVIFGLSV